MSCNAFGVQSYSQKIPDRRRILRIVTYICLIFTLVGLGGVSWLAWEIDRAASVDEARPVDAIIVLGAVVAADGTPS